MKENDVYALALELLALGRIFLLRVAYQSYFDKELVPHRVVSLEESNQPLPRATYNPALGRSLTEMLLRVTRECGRREWANAEGWGQAAGAIKNLAAIYRGTINVEMADAVARYYLCAVGVGKNEIAPAVQMLTETAEQLAFTMPDLSAPFWLALARIHLQQGDAANALWALEKSSGLSKDCKTSVSQVLRPLLEASYAQVTMG